MAKKIIYGCEGRGDADTPYLTRWTLLQGRWGQVCLHKFHRSDHDVMHDHPWAFVSLILWRGYVEETPRGEWRDYNAFEESDRDWPRTEARYHDGRWQVREIARKRVWPGMVLFRRATHIHRVELVKDKPAWTLLVMGPYVRQWGFWVDGAWEHFRDYFRRLGC